MTTRCSQDPADQRRCHALLLTAHTKLADNETFEWMTSKGNQRIRRAWREVGEFLSNADHEVGKGCDVYIGLGVRRCPSGGEVGRCGCDHPFDREHVSRVMAAAADLDVKSPPKGFSSKAAAYKALQTCGRVPSFIVESGGGLHVYWLFPEPLMDRDRFTNIQRGIARFFHSDPIVDPSRVLRLAGTVNHKYGEPRPTHILGGCEVQEEHDFVLLTHTADEIEQAFPYEHEEKRQADDRQAHDDFVPRGDAEPPAGKFAALMEDAKFAASWRHERSDLRDTSASGYDLSLARLAAAAGWVDQEIVDLLIAHRRRHGADRKLRRRDYYDRTLRAARADLHRQRCGSDGRRPNGFVNDVVDEDDSRPTVNVADGEMDRATTAMWQAVQQRNDPPTLFRFGAMPSRIEATTEGNPPCVQPLTVDRLRFHIGKMVRTVNVSKSNECSVWPPKDLIGNMLAAPEVPLPALIRITATPIVAPDGTITTTPGYCAATRTYYDPAPGLVVPAVRDEPSEFEIHRARELLVNELIGEFPFVSEADRQHALALLLLPFVRELVDGPTPLHLIEKPVAGTGGTLLATVTTLPAIGAVAGLTEAADEEEWRKKITAKLMQTPAVFLIDNVRRPLDSAALSSAITGTAWEDRILGLTKNAHIPVRCVWVATGNNPTLSDEMARRSVRIRLDANEDQPWLITSYRHSELRGWAREHRGDLVWAALTLARSWIVAGRPAGDRSLGMFESWATVIGGILQHHGYAAFLENATEFYATADSESATWRAFVESWWARHAGAEVFASALVEIASEAGLDLGEGNFNSQSDRLGKLLRGRRDRIIANYKLMADDRLLHGKRRWKLLQRARAAA